MFILFLFENFYYVAELFIYSLISIRFAIPKKKKEKKKVIKLLM